MRRTFRAACLALALAGLAVLAAPAGADPPVYSGLTNFPTIKGPADFEDFSWKVALGPGQELKQLNDQEAAVFYDDEHLAMTIVAEQAHDATGAVVPTSLAVSAPDIVTLTVHHRAGNPAAGGALFRYPISPDPPFEAGNSTVIVTGPLDDAQLREEREKREREAAEAAARTTQEPPRGCRVPALRTESLRAAKRLLRNADCAIGAVAKRRGATAAGGRVVVQHPRAGTALPAGAEVGVTLGVRSGS